MLIDCPECGKRVSSEAISCPHCGFRHYREDSNYVPKQEAALPYRGLAFAFAIILLVAIYTFNSHQILSIIVILFAGAVLIVSLVMAFVVSD